MISWKHCACYNYCRNRNCPKCQGAGARPKWLRAAQAKTAGGRISRPSSHCRRWRPIAFQKQGHRLGRSFRGCRRERSHHRRRSQASGPQMASLRVPHNWGRPCSTIRTFIAWCRGRGGRPLARRHAMVAGRPGFFLPVRVLARLCRRLFCRTLRLHSRRQAALLRQNSAGMASHGLRQNPGLTNQAESNGCVSPSRLGGPEQVLDYLGRSTIDVAIATAG